MSSGSQIVSGIPVQRTVRALQSLPTSFFSPQHQLPLCQGIQKVNGSQKPVRLLLSHISLSRTFYSTRRIAAAPTQALPATLLVGLPVQLSSALCASCISATMFLMSVQSIALTDESPAWTLDQIAGLVFGVRLHLYVLTKH